jgi:hypothetical protein
MNGKTAIDGQSNVGQQAATYDARQLTLGLFGCW